MIKASRISKVQKKLDGLTEKYVNDKIDDETYTKFNQRFRKDLAMLTAEVTQANMINQSDPMEMLNASFGLLLNMRNVYENASSEKRQSLIKLVFKRKNNVL